MRLKYLILAISLLLPNLAFSDNFGDIMSDKASKIRLSDPYGFFGASPAIADDLYGRYASPPNVQSALMELGASHAVVGSTFLKLDQSASQTIVNGAPNFSAGLISSGAGDVQIGTSSVVSDIYFANAQADIKGNGSGAYTIGQAGETWNLNTAATYNFSNMTFPADSNFTLSGGVNALSFDGTTFSVDATNNRIGLGTASPSYDLDIVHNQNAETSIGISNTTAGTASVAGLRLIEDTSRGGSFFLTSSSYTGVTGYADVVWIDAGTSTANGIILSAAKSTADIKFYAGGRASSDLALTLNDDLSAVFTGTLAVNGVTGATPSPLFTMGSYYDNAGSPSVSHIALYGTTIGFGVSSISLDYISGTGGDHNFYSNPASASIFTLNGTTNTATLAGTLAVNGDTITCDSGTLSFDNENLITTGTLGAGATTVDSLTTDTGGITLLAGQDIRPSADSTTAINIAQADGTDFVTFDTTNKYALFTSPNYPVIRGTRTSALTNTIRAGISCRHQTTDDMVNGFGAGFSFDVMDSAGVNNPIAGIYGVRAGADNSGDLHFQTYLSGTGTVNAIMKNNAHLLINTTDDDGTPSTGQFVAKGSTNDGSTNIFVGRDSDGANVTTLDTNGNLITIGKTASTKIDKTLGIGVTTFAITNDVIKLTGDGGGNTIATITGGISGQIVTLLFVDALVTITDTAAATADTVNLSAAFTSSADDTLTLVYDGNKFFEVARSVN